MSVTYQKADEKVLMLLEQVRDQWHPNLRDANVQIGVLMALNPDGDAVTHGGYAALAKIKPVSLKDRVSKSYDAELVIDESKWLALPHEQRVSLLDHELSHLDTIPVPPEELAKLRAENADAPGWKLDDLGRPRLRSIPGNWNAGDGFRDVVARHGHHAVEYLNLSNARAAADAARQAGAEV